MLSLQERKFVGGANQISECMARELGELVKLKSPVYSIDQTGHMVLVQTLDNRTYSVRPSGCSPSPCFEDTATSPNVFTQGK